jgi:LacI family transcriptional regulator
LNLHQVSSNQIEGTKQIAALLHSHGHRSIGVLQGLPGTYPNQTRVEGLRSALEDFGIELHDALIAGDNFTEASGYKAAQHLLTKNPQLTAIVALSIPNAFGGLRAAIELGRKVPDDLSIIGFDDSPFADFMQVPFSTIRQDEHQLGRVAAHILLNQLQEPSNQISEPKLHVLPCELVERSSVAKVKML